MLSALPSCSVFRGGLISANAVPVSQKAMGWGDLTSIESIDFPISNFRFVLQIDCRMGAQGKFGDLYGPCLNDGSPDHPRAVFTRGASRIDGCTKSAPLHFIEVLYEAFSFCLLHLSGV